MPLAEDEGVVGYSDGSAEGEGCRDGGAGFLLLAVHAESGRARLLAAAGAFWVNTNSCQMEVAALSIMVATFTNIIFRGAAATCVPVGARGAEPDLWKLTAQLRDYFGNIHNCGSFE